MIVYVMIPEVIPVAEFDSPYYSSDIIKKHLEPLVKNILDKKYNEVLVFTNEYVALKYSENLPSFSGTLNAHVQCPVFTVHIPDNFPFRESKLTKELKKIFRPTDDYKFLLDDYKFLLDDFIDFYENTLFWTMDGKLICGVISAQVLNYKIPFIKDYEIFAAIPVISDKIRRYEDGFTFFSKNKAISFKIPLTKGDLIEFLSKLNEFLSLQKNHNRNSRSYAMALSIQKTIYNPDNSALYKQYLFKILNSILNLPCLINQIITDYSAVSIDYIPQHEFEMPPFFKKSSHKYALFQQEAAEEAVRVLSKLLIYDNNPLNNLAKLTADYYISDDKNGMPKPR